MKLPKLPINTGFEARTLRLKRGLNQDVFWGPLEVSQSTASRYEHGRELPGPVRLLLNVAYGPPSVSSKVVAFLRTKRHGRV